MRLTNAQAEKMGLIDRPSKYGAQLKKVDGITFHSKKEANYYRYLIQARDKAKTVHYFLRQVPFDLGGGTKYRVDFVVFYTDGRIEYIDVKGYETPDFKRSKKQVEALYPVEISVVKKIPRGI